MRAKPRSKQRTQATTRKTPTNKQRTQATTRKTPTQHQQKTTNTQREQQTTTASEEGAVLLRREREEEEPKMSYHNYDWQKEKFEDWLLLELYYAYTEARKGKRSTIDEHMFEVNAMDNLMNLRDTIMSRRYEPGATNYNLSEC